jgi:hypothetical protein
VGGLGATQFRASMYFSGYKQSSVSAELDENGDMQLGAQGLVRLDGTQGSTAISTAMRLRHSEVSREQVLEHLSR